MSRCGLENSSKQPSVSVRRQCARLQEELCMSKLLSPIKLPRPNSNPIPCRRSGGRRVVGAHPLRIVRRRVITTAASSGITRSSYCQLTVLASRSSIVDRVQLFSSCVLRVRCFRLHHLLLLHQAGRTSEAR